MNAPDFFLAQPNWVLWSQVASVMGLMSVALDLLLLIHPMSVVQDDSKESTSSRQDLRNDMQDLENAGFLKACKGIPDSWDFAQVCYAALYCAVYCLVSPASTHRIAFYVLCFAGFTALQGHRRLLKCSPAQLCCAVLHTVSEAWQRLPDSFQFVQLRCAVLCFLLHANSVSLQFNLVQLSVQQKSVMQLLAQGLACDLTHFISGLGTFSMQVLARDTAYDLIFCGRACMHAWQRH